MNIGLFFGTFDPVHNGHVTIVDNMLSQKKIDEVWVVLTPLSPFKKSKKIVSFEARMKMLRMAFKNKKNVVVSDFERKLKPPNYTIDTLCYLKKQYPKNKFSIILGSDNFQNINLWKDYKLILNNYHIFIYPRNNIGRLFPKHSLRQKTTQLDMALLPISSTSIRKKINTNKSFLGDVNTEVRQYIINKKLYLKK